LRAILAFRRAAGELRPFGRAHAVAGDVLRLDAKLLHLLDHRPTLRVHAAIHDDVGILGLDLGQDRLEVGRLVVGIFASDDGPAGGLYGLLRLVGQTRAIRRFVVDDRDLLAAQRSDRFLADHAALLHVVRHDAERGLEALQGQLRIGRGWRDLGYARVAVDLGGGDRRAGV